MNKQNSTDLEMETQNKTINELQNDIKEFQKHERAYIVSLQIKDKEIRQLQNLKNDLTKKASNSTTIYNDSLVLNEFNYFKNLIKEKDDYLLAKEEELHSLQVNPNHPLFKKLVNKCRDLHKENMELYNYTQGGTLENLRYENSLEKGQIDQLMLKIKEKENVREEIENDIDEVFETIFSLQKKMKELEERNTELEKELKTVKKDKY